ncbi:hypothetical protein ABC977_11645 [Thioalkalicoccus limnaeus]|uniref:DNA-binding protein n=1 Tax=Thioalkalicoccus limnaeus TaxID=120681 RepID=A0ABV4BHU5_9GAMM
MKHATLIIVAITIALFAAVNAWAQRGVGDDTGVARWPEQPAIQRIAGRVSDVKIAQCEQTTGRADVGAHVFVDTDDGRTLNVHLGPFDVLADLVTNVDDGIRIAARVFRTDSMPPDHFVAITVTIADQETRLRSDDDLRPVWAREPRQRGPRAGDPGHQGQRAYQLRGRGPVVTDPCWWQPPRRQER